MGVTIVCASGDDGAVSRDVRTYGSLSCSYSPTWPATSPYVLAVGATQGVESDDEEIACQSQLGIYI
jgi:subtilase family serine protease